MEIRVLIRNIFSVFAAVLVVLSSGCDKVVNLKIDKAPSIDYQSFLAAEGLKLPYEFYMPSSMVGWELSDSTRLTYNEKTKTYIIDNVPMDKPMMDNEGPRFKLCSYAWQYQFGFGGSLTDDESTFGIPKEGVVLEVDLIPKASADLRVEYSQRELNDLKDKVVRLEFKLIRWNPSPRALIYVSAH